MSEIIWTKHALKRNKERKINQKWIEKTIKYPDNYSRIEGEKIESNKNFGNHTVTVITKRTESGNNLILSAWINPPVKGTKDYKKEKYYKSLKNSSGYKKLLIILKNHLGF